MTDSAHAPIAVVGIGNILLGDDGFGPCVIDFLHAHWEFPEMVALIDAGTPGLDLVTYFHDREVVILVDTVAAIGSPGDVLLYHGEDLHRLPAKPRVSPHDPVVHESLCIAQLAGRGPQKVRLVGVIPASREVSLDLSAPVRGATSTAAALVVRELITCGAVPVARNNARAGGPWWTCRGCADASMA